MMDRKITQKNREARTESREEIRYHENDFPSIENEKYLCSRFSVLESVQ